MAAFGQQQSRLAEGQITQTIYGLIRDGKFGSAIEHLTQQLQFVPNSRAALSLLAYCQYHSGQYEQAASTYEHLGRICPSNDSYRLYCAQAMYKAGMYAEASKAAVRISSPELASQVNTLLAVNAYEHDDLPGCRRQLDRCVSTAGCEVEVAINTGCVLFKEGDYAGAAAKFNEAAAIEGSQPELQYNLALCCYKLKQYSQALKHLAEIVEKGVREHPELGIGSQLDGMEVRSVGNSQVLKETALVEAFNLKAAVEIVMKNNAAAAEALADMPPRSESELDPVTLHNLALVSMERDPGAGFKKLNFLLGSGAMPRETFANLLLLYCAPQHGFFDLAADVMAENPGYCSSLMDKDLLELLQCLINGRQQPEASLQQLDELAGRHIEGLRALTKAIQDARLSRNNDAIRAAIQRYDEALERYIPVLMAMGSVFWERGAYSALEHLFRQSAEFCSEHEAWKLNVAHTFFMQETKYRDAIRYYQPLVAANASNLLGVTAIVLANLCVSYIMTSQNEDAEELMRQVEREEEAAAAADPEGLQLHLCIINLVIGTLYCSKGNYEFGISRIIKSLEPYHSKLSTDTWFYAKRCFLSLAEGLAKHMIPFKEASWQEVLTFLQDIEKVGKSIPAAFAGAGAAGAGVGGGVQRRLSSEEATVASEARQLRGMFSKLQQMA
ncbi:hypothetical protein OEZ85_004572 [Tetradesmus obliquus]|uniref:Uncharacterized protein n=1 Tax=Tetradesmus obliquus TaxID=3088 RepID=A0ABY8UPP8_TETOB|nr:hypothetical protein OEZ85_004572 [Tetradesmus obliquus]